MTGAENDDEKVQQNCCGIHAGYLYSAGVNRMEGTRELKTERLVLRRYRVEDSGELYEKFGSDPEMYRYSG